MVTLSVERDVDVVVVAAGEVGRVGAAVDRWSGRWSRWGVRWTRCGLARSGSAPRTSAWWATSQGARVQPRVMSAGSWGWKNRSQALPRGWSLSGFCRWGSQQVAPSRSAPGGGEGAVEGGGAGGDVPAGAGWVGHVACSDGQAVRGAAGLAVGGGLGEHGGDVGVGVVVGEHRGGAGWWARCGRRGSRRRRGWRRAGCTATAGVAPPGGSRWRARTAAKVGCRICMGPPAPAVFWPVWTPGRVLRPWSVSTCRWRRARPSPGRGSRWRPVGRAPGSPAGCRCPRPDSARPLGRSGWLARTLQPRRRERRPGPGRSARRERPRPRTGAVHGRARVVPHRVASPGGAPWPAALVPRRSW